MHNNLTVALLTIWHVQNFGAEIQTYATIKVLQKLGLDVKVIDYRLSDEAECSNPIKKGIKDILQVFTPNFWNFYLFWRKNIPKTKRYRSLKQLKNDPPKADIYLIGSDQVWNPDIVGEALPAYFLNFGNDQTIRISYASSFGVTEWKYPKVINDSISQFLSTFNAISCREKTGVNILNNIFDISASNVLDPTLLLDDYSQIAKCEIAEPFVAYYPLSPNEEISATAGLIAKKLDCKLININKKLAFRSLTIKRTSLEEWIGAIAKASFVITSSFHGLTMCLVHRRQFAIVFSDETIRKRSSRVLDLLDSIGLNDRYFESCEDLVNSNIWEYPIDYNSIEQELNNLKEKSMYFLKNALLNAPQK